MANTPEVPTLTEVSERLRNPPVYGSLNDQGGQDSCLHDQLRMAIQNGPAGGWLNRGGAFDERSSCGEMCMDRDDIVIPRLFPPKRPIVALYKSLLVTAGLIPTVANGGVDSAANSA